MFGTVSSNKYCWLFDDVILCRTVSIVKLIPSFKTHLVLTQINVYQQTPLYVWICICCDSFTRQTKLLVFNCKSNVTNTTTIIQYDVILFYICSLSIITTDDFYAQATTILRYTFLCIHRKSILFHPFAHARTNVNRFTNFLLWRKSYKTLTRESDSIWYRKWYLSSFPFSFSHIKMPKCYAKT